MSAVREKAGIATPGRAAAYKTAWSFHQGTYVKVSLAGRGPEGFEFHCWADYDAMKYLGIYREQDLKEFCL